MDPTVLLIERELQQVLTAYARMCDERDWAAIDAVFSDDAHAEYGGWALPDRGAILRMLIRNLGGCGPTQHLLGNLTVEHGPDGPRSRISVRAAHRGSAELADQTYECLGEYLDHWVATPRGWRIRHRRMVITLEIGSRRLLRPAPG